MIPTTDVSYPMNKMAMTTTTARQYASFWRRFSAALIDGIVVSIIVGIIYVWLGLWMWLSLGETAEQGEAIAFVTVFSLMALVACWLYWALMESSDTQATLGKMALGIVVTDLEGRRISFGKATRRHFGKIASTLILFLDSLWPVVQPRGKLYTT